MEPTVTLYEADVEEHVPILPEVYFDSANSSIPNSYHKYGDAASTAAFREDAIPIDALTANVDVLNIVGARMARYRSTRICILGFGYRGEMKDVKSDSLLASNRCEAVRQYLLNIWGIAPHRVDVSHEARIVLSGGAHERSAIAADNRKVELTVYGDYFADRDHDWREAWRAVLAPLRRRTKMWIASPAIVSFTVHPEMRRSKPENATIQIRRGTLTWDEVSVDLTFDSSCFYDWRSFESTQLDADSTAFDIRAVVHWGDGHDDTTETHRVRVRIVPKAASDGECQSRLRVVHVEAPRFFHYNYNHLNRIDYLLLDDVIAPAVERQSMVHVFGRLSNIGLPDRNRRLAAQQAFEAAHHILTSAPAEGVQVVRLGIGSELPRYSNATPVGRALNTAIDVSVYTLTPDD